MIGQIDAVLLILPGFHRPDRSRQALQDGFLPLRVRSPNPQLEREGGTAGEFERRMAEIDRALKREGGAIEELDEVLARQLVGTIKVLDKDRALVSGTDVDQVIGRSARASA